MSCGAHQIRSGRRFVAQKYLLSLSMLALLAKVLKQKHCLYPCDVIYIIPARHNPGTYHGFGDMRVCVAYTSCNATPQQISLNAPHLVNSNISH